MNTSLETITAADPPWRHIGVSYGSHAFLIDGVDVFAAKWTAAEGRPQAPVVDPLHGQTFHFPVYRIITGTRETVFAAGEYSNNVWGFYVLGTEDDIPDPSGRGVDANMAAPAHAASIAATPPPMRVTSKFGIVAVWPTWRDAAPYVSLALALVTIPWVFFVAILHVGAGSPPDPGTTARTLYVAEAVAPAVIGLVVGLYALCLARPRHVFGTFIALLGCVGCGGLLCTLFFLRL